MTGFTSLDGFSPLLNFLVGLASFCGLFGFGLLAVKRILPDLPSPWREVIAVVFGVQTTSLGVQILGMVQAASPLVLSLFWLAITVVGVAALFREVYGWFRLPRSFQLNLSYLLIFCGLLGIFLNLIMATTPSTKADEIFYHMLLPSRIVTDQALVFYLYPWQGAVLPQMLYQIATTPLHAIGFPHAGNICSWALSLLLLWFSGYLVFDKARSAWWTQIVITSFVIGLYPVVWYVTSGGHAFGDLCVAAVVVAIPLITELSTRCRLATLSLAISLLALSAASTKITLLPLAAMVYGYSQFRLITLANSKQERNRVLLSGLAPWMVFYLPILLWTWNASGSPFGPVLAGQFGESVYHLTEIRETLAESQIINRLSFYSGVVNSAFSYSLLLVAVTLGFFTIRRFRFSMPTLLFLVQVGLIAFVVPYDLRFLGGVHYGLAILFGMYLATRRRHLLETGKGWAILIALSLLPWLAVQAAYTSPFASFLVGKTAKEGFYERYVAFYQDHIQLDRLLPREATLLVRGVRLNSIYAARPVVFSTLDAEGRAPLFWFHVEGKEDSELEAPTGYVLGEQIYNNPRAVTETPRSPGQTVRQGHLRVFRLDRKKR